MKIQQLRNATFILTLGSRRFLVDPMLSGPGKLPAFKVFSRERQRNPIVALPEEAKEALKTVTDVLITHEHMDHIDRAGMKWIKDRDLPVWASPIDTPYLKKKGLKVTALENGAMDMKVELVPTKHSRGLLSWLLGPVTGFYLAHPREPSIYLTSDAVLTEHLLKTLDRLKPDVIVAPAGSANFGLGPDLLFSVNELVTLTKRVNSKMIFNHLEAIDHCPTTRDELKQRMSEEGLAARVFIPKDGEEMEFLPDANPSVIKNLGIYQPTGRFQKWLTGQFAGT
ncbi:MAG: MBL fold metallo-hydrolase [Planctomycetota bacterium]|nr:MBL fold metallo-hydrolase [Planctomycetota bacterium]